MSDVKVIVNLLTTNSSLLADVPAARIMAGVIPENTVLPCIGVSHVSTIRRHTVAGTATEFCTSRVQVTIKAASYKSQKRIVALVRSALPRTRGTVNGVNVDSLMHELDGPDFSNENASILMQSLDYIITYNE